MLSISKVYYNLPCTLTVSILFVVVVVVIAFLFCMLHCSSGDFVLWKMWVSFSKESQLGQKSIIGSQRSFEPICIMHTAKCCVVLYAALRGIIMDTQLPGEGAARLQEMEEHWRR